ncbi:hypothetical protein OG496_30390 [Streptomyces sp. NBC_00988]|uniref:hypothetical protein n=1 Tax=Streptomyces sp. NBC_00988 TaxID=2903704 RepID=UPI003869A51A|nr:hypothetical protein OG496_30390 [Streptomyces sp. NBC_00988]
MRRGMRRRLRGLWSICLVLVVWRTPGTNDLCVRVVHDPHTAGTYDVTVSVRHEGGSAGDTALVTFDASTY